MSALSQFIGGARYGVPLSAMDTTIVPSSVVANRLYGYTAAATLSAGADVWQTMLDASGSAGVLCGAIISQGSANAQVITLRVTVDGQAYELASGSTVAAKAVFIAGAMSYDGTSLLVSPSSHIEFTTSLKIEAKRSATAVTAAAHWAYALKRN